MLLGEKVASGPCPTRCDPRCDPRCDRLCDTWPLTARCTARGHAGGRPRVGGLRPRSRRGWPPPSLLLPLPMSLLSTVGPPPAAALPPTRPLPLSTEGVYSRDMGRGNSREGGGRSNECETASRFTPARRCRSPYASPTVPARRCRSRHGAPRGTRDAFNGSNGSPCARDRWSCSASRQAQPRQVSRPPPLTPPPSRPPHERQ